MDRLYETAGSATRRYLYDGANVIAEYDTTGAIVNRYVQGPGADEQLVWWAGSAMADRRFEVNDERNSVTVVTDGCASPAFALRAPGPSPEGEGEGMSAAIWSPSPPEGEGGSVSAGKSGRKYRGNTGFS